ncbi:IS21 family transposase [Actinomycetospora soli]|uniref:IS21 family transposase n=1 Tax=Actinomycetospora soli TaxID=2893887 RepID=UPI001E2FD75E|nr:IS21 family transposase [Actinomycetospora soli]MCD2191005.1 IS21 family transposase [Actinomycetospora soli]
MARRVELFEAIRRDRRLEGLSIRALAERHEVHRRTVRQALASAVPPPRKAGARPAPKLDRWKPVIDAWLEADQQSPVKQRHTARRVWQRLGAEHGAELAEITVSRYVRAWRAEHRPQVEVMVAQEHLPGQEAEVDFGEFVARIDGVETKCHLFVLRLSASGKAVQVAFTNQGQEAFLEGHARAFAALCGVPARIRYDNLKAAVSRVLQGRDRDEAERFVALRSHYGFDSFFCRPGQEGSHEKGGVEGEVGRFRRRHLVPIPEVASLTELNEFIAGCASIDDARHLPGRQHDIAAEFAAERRALQPVPRESFETGVILWAGVDRHARVRVRSASYSVPARLVGRKVRVMLRACELVVLDGRREVARHERSAVKNSVTLRLDHYLEVLCRKPGALPGSVALAQARADGSFTSEHEAFWAAARRALGDGAGTRELVEVLLLHRHLPHAVVLAGLRAAISVGAVRADVVAVEARRHQQDHTPIAVAASSVDSSLRVVSLTERRLADPGATVASLPADTRPLPTVAAYDELLARRSPTGTSSASSSTGEVS